MINSIGIANANFGISSVSAPSMAAEAAPTQEIEFSYNPQDNVIMSPVTTNVSDVTIGKNGPETSRVELQAKLEPNAEGKYVFDREDTKNYTSAHTFATVAKTLDMFQTAFGEKVPWRSEGDKITVRPDRGEMLNAYYSRSDCSVNFFHSYDTTLGEMVYSGQSGEAVSHEVGHAMLDGIRPGYLNSWSPDPLGFHESFADMMGLFMATQNDASCEIAAKETGGDMKKENCLARTAEELGSAINRSVGRNSTGGDFIRNANNDWKWQDPSTLPENPGSDKLGTEMHNWSRVWTGAVYDIFAGMVARNVDEGMSPKDAIKAGGAEMIELYGRLMHEAPQGDFTYKQMANCMLKVDGEQMDGRNSALIRNSMTNRLILPEGEEGLDDLDIGPRESRMMTVTLNGDGFGMFAGAKVETPVDANASRSIFASAGEDKATKDLKHNMKRLIDAGRILYTEPNQHLEPKDMFDKNGVPYMGIVRWVDGNMVIERNHVIG